MLSSRLNSVSKTSSRPTLRSNLTISSPTIILRSASKLPRNEQTRHFRIGFWSHSFGSEAQKEPIEHHRILKHKCVDAINWKLLFLSAVPSRHGDAFQRSRVLFNKLLSQNSLLERRLVNLFDRYDSLSFAVRLGPKVFVRMHSYSSDDPEYDIDPITNRKVPKKSSVNSTGTSEESSDIPVKTFKEDRARHPNLSNTSVHTTTRWGNCCSPPKSTIDSPSPEELATYRQGYYHEEPEEWYPKGKGKGKNKSKGKSEIPYMKFYGTKDGIEHRTESDQVNLMEYETKYEIEYSKGFYYDEPLEWYPRKGKPKEDKEAERAKLEDDYIQTQKISRRADEVYANRVALLKAEQDRRRNQEISRQASEIFDKQTALVKAEEERRRTQGIIRKADEVHSTLVANQEAEEKRRKAQAIVEQTREIHSCLARNEAAEKVSRQLKDLTVENSELRNQAAHLEGRIAAKIDKVNANIPPAPRLTGSFVRDFPEEFKESWKAQHDFEGPLSKVEEAEKKVQNAENEYVHGRAPKEAFSRCSTTPRMETSLDRSVYHAHLMAEKDKSEKEKNDAILRKIQEDNDEYSKEPMGLETSYRKERAMWGISNLPLFSKTYGTLEKDSTMPKERGVTSDTSKAAIKKDNVDCDGYSQEPMGLQTSYAEECQREGKPMGQVWSSSYGSTAKPEDEWVDEHGYSKKPMGLETSFVRECLKEGKPMGQLISTSYGEPAKSVPDVDGDGYSTKPMGLQTSYAEECKREGKPMGELHSISYGKSERATDASADDKISEVSRRAPSTSSVSKKDVKEMDEQLIRNVRAIYEEAYGTIDTKHRQVPVSTTEQVKNAASHIADFQQGTSPEPNQYKILAYDPTMQSVSMADAISIVTDSASALTPAEVLLRLSNPTKFFPHFGPLQAQGYEIVSGSGDVLVFRKVRPGESVSKTQDSKKKINPIDGMESKPIAATGNFASPTGFVNHDMPVDPPFKSNIDVRREEPVFSGTKTTWTDTEDGSKRKSRGRGKRLVLGAFWVGACSYAVGVVAEFFRTGGIDGKGPVGF